MIDYLENDAVLSDCGKYRYLLRRNWDHDKVRALIVMLNPSTANAEVDDPTIRSCVRLCKWHGYGSFEVVNLFGVRSADPAFLGLAIDPVGPENDRLMEAAVNRCDLIICAWGTSPYAINRVDAVLHILRHRPANCCWGITKSGAPKHPLYIKTGTPLLVYRA